MHHAVIPSLFMQSKLQLNFDQNFRSILACEDIAVERTQEPQITTESLAEEKRFEKCPLCLLT